ncbi:MAG: DUF411 domain-containing protein [Rhodoferax sp.]|uniref:DUF411 domain-containing protein n=1 Tax=Rhodoferax sp. TaxID=50421 RepID=UPI00261D4D68|nr:DUF411 domain-containing protein [Rhodoferax sp.]MDD2883239.1 DUF411 domain-containing protein [Rhodoferax sp.]
MQRRYFLQTASVMLASASLLSASVQAKTEPTVEVWKTVSCGCCHDWVAHMQANGFHVITHDVSEAEKAAKRASVGIPAQLGSCHTALVKGYALEGHVPASDVRRLLKERPKAAGLTVPGMPIGSPGMDGPAYGGRKDPYATLLVQRDGSSSIFQNH